MSQHNIELKDRWNFYLGFELPQELQQHAKAIELMVAAVDLGAENLTPLFNSGEPDPVGQHSNLHHRSGRLIVWLYDDLHGDMMRSIRALQAANPEFTIRVSYCGEHGIPEYEAYVMTGCHLECLQHSLLSYEKTHETIELSGFDADNTLRGSERATIKGTISNSASKATVMKLLQISFTGMTHINNVNPA